MVTCNCSELSFFEHSALGSSRVFQAEAILFETTYRKPPSAGLFIHNIISISVILPKESLLYFPDEIETIQHA
ncbi:unnamed protein product [Hymenolepis diminuta]|uniref:Uncharacterized protein n=1 Tax=Hymenolepis diminuta TaxID=6216 RepID=A0A564Y500_HYMDI|nr:unnamed protein product [Hymenolepis diminuta]